MAENLGRETGEDLVMGTRIFTVQDRYPRRYTQP